MIFIKTYRKKKFPKEKKKRNVSVFFFCTKVLKVGDRVVKVK